MAISKYTPYKHVKVGGTWRYCKAAYHENGKIKPDIVFVNVKQSLLERHPEGRYYMSHNGQWLDAATDALEAQRKRKQRLALDEFKRLNCRGSLYSILAITVKDEKLRSRFKWKRFPELLNDPQARRMLRDIEVQDSPSVVTDHEEAVEHAEPNGWNHEEVHRRDGFPMIAQKGKPSFGPFRISRCSFHPARNGSFRHIETKHEKLAVDARRAPGRILNNHPKDEISDLPWSPSSANDPAGLRNDTPIERESRSMPVHDGLGAHDDECLFPSEPEPSRQNPEEPIEYCEFWPGMFSFQYRQLLTKS